MKTAIIFLILFVTFAASFKDDNNWKAWKKQHKKAYKNDADELKRYNRFLKTDAKIKDHNKKFKEGYVLFEKAHNQFSAMEYSEIQKMLPKLKPIPTARSLPLPPALPQTPESVSYQKYSFPPLSQGQCATCWAFAAAAVVEIRLKQKYSSFNSYISPQHLIHSAPNQACLTSGSPVDGLNIMYKNGMVNLDDYPYVASDDGDYYPDAPYMSYYLSSGAKTVNLNGNEATLKNLIASKGPVVVQIWASPDEFAYYSTGVYSDPNGPTDCATYNHAVVLLGYGVDTTTWPGMSVPYWLAKNSWGDAWGDGGYIKIIRNYPGYVNNCNTACVAMYATVY